MRKLFKFWTSPAEALIIVVFALFLIGCINIFSSSFVMAGHWTNDSYFFLKRHLVASGIGLVLMIFLAWADYRKLVNKHESLLVLMIGLLLAVHYIGINGNGSTRWIKIGVQFQPSEVAKVIVIMLAASYLGPRLDRKRKITLKSWPIVVTLIAGFLVYKQPDMGTAVVIVGLCFLLYIIAGISKHEQVLLLSIVVTGVIYLTFKAGYRAERIIGWLDPWAHQQTSGYQIVQSLMAIGSGGLFGNGLGMGSSKFFYLPEAHTDFAFSVLCQEMGFIGATIVLLLIGGLCYFGMQIAIRASDGTGSLLAGGMTALLVGQAVGNIAMVTGIIPVTGIPLPFISYGGTSVTVSLAAIGMIISVSRYTKKDSTESVGLEKKPRLGSIRLKRVK